MIFNLIFPLDYIILIISILFIVFSGWKGLIQSILGLLTWVGSIIITLYTYNTLANYLGNQLQKIEIFQNYQSLSNFVSIIIAIPFIFLISLFLLKRIRKILSADLDKQILGIIIDKTFGMIYGVIFSYFIFSTAMFALSEIQLENINNWLISNSEILNTIKNYNEQYIYNFLPYNETNTTID